MNFATLRKCRPEMKRVCEPAEPVTAVPAKTCRKVPKTACKNVTREVVEEECSPGLVTNSILFC